MTFYGQNIFSKKNMTIVVLLLGSQFREGDRCLGYSFKLDALGQRKLLAVVDRAGMKKL